MKLGNSQIIEVNDRIVLHRFVGTPFNEGNIICISMENGLIFIDSGRIIDVAKEFRDKMENKFQKKAILLILTHTHGDHIFGMQAFADVPIIMGYEGKQEMKTLEEQGLFTQEGRKARLDKIIEQIQDEKPDWVELFKEDFAKNQIKSDIFYPQVLVKDEMFITDGVHDLEIKVCGGHSPSSLTILDKSTKTLITGDNLNSDHADSSPCMLSRAYLAIDLIKEFLQADIENYVPGHGRIVKKPYLKDTLQYLINLKKSLIKLKRINIPEEEIFNHPDIPKFYEDQVPDFLNRVLSIWYQNLETEISES